MKNAVTRIAVTLTLSVLICSAVSVSFAQDAGKPKIAVYITSVL